MGSPAVGRRREDGAYGSGVAAGGEEREHGGGPGALGVGDDPAGPARRTRLDADHPRQAASRPTAAGSTPRSSRSQVCTGFFLAARMPFIEG